MCVWSVMVCVWSMMVCLECDGVFVQCDGVCGVCAGRVLGVSGVSLAALLSGYLGKSGHLPRYFLEESS